MGLYRRSSKSTSCLERYGRSPVQAGCVIRRVLRLFANFPHSCALHVTSATFAMPVFLGSVTNPSPSARRLGADIMQHPSKSMTGTPEKLRKCIGAAVNAEHKHVSHKAQAAPCLSGKHDVHNCSSLMSQAAAKH